MYVLQEDSISALLCYYAPFLGGLVYYDHDDPTANYSTSLFTNISCSGDENTLQECTVHEGDCLIQCDQNIGLKCFGKTLIFNLIT